MSSLNLLMLLIICFSIWAKILPTLLSLKSIIVKFFYSFKESCYLVYHNPCISAFEFVHLSVVCEQRQLQVLSDIQFLRTR